MRKNTKWTGLLALAPACGLVIALASAPAHANAILTIDDGGANSITLSDGGTGVVGYYGMLDGLQLDFAVGTTDPLIGTATQPALHVAGGILAGIGTLNFSFTNDNFVGTGSKEFLSDIAVDLWSGASFTGSAWLLDGSGTRVAQLASFGPSSDTFSDVQSAVESVSGTYGLELAGTLTQTQSGASSFDTSVAVPEPGTLALFGLGLVGLGFAFTRRKHSSGWVGATA